MANSKLVKKLKSGVSDWNKWRECETPQKPSLSYAGLSYADLSGADLSGADLSGADLSGADLSGANLTYADLSYADLSYAILRFADLSYANLSGAKLEAACLIETVFANVNMAGTRELINCIHEGPSSVDHRTLIKSGPLPPEFLRGCGFQDWQIESAKLLREDLTYVDITDIAHNVITLRAEARMLIGSIFISYNHRDSEFVDALQGKLTAKQVPSWRDIHDATAGRLDRVIEDAMRLNTVLLVLSKNSVNRDWVEFELRKARELEREQNRVKLCPIMLDDAWKTASWSGDLKNQLMKYVILDFSRWKQSAEFENRLTLLLRGLNLYYPKESSTATGL